VADSIPTLQNDNQDTLSGAGAIDATTKVPYQDLTGNILYNDYEDSTRSQTLDEEGKVSPPMFTLTEIEHILYLLAQKWLSN